MLTPLTNKLPVTFILPITSIEYKGEELLIPSLKLVLSQNKFEVLPNEELV